MTRDPLVASELELVRSLLRELPEIESATLFGSRAKGTHSERSDVDLALAGLLGDLGAEAIAAELEELPLPYRLMCTPWRPFPTRRCWSTLRGWGW